MTTLSDILTRASARLLESGRIYLGVQPSQYEALGSAFLERGNTHPSIERELATVCAAMALDPELFFESAWLVSRDVVAATTAALTEVRKLLSGPGELLRWSQNSEGGIVRDPDELIRLQLAVRRARFAKNNATEQVNTEVLARARIAQEALLAYHRDGPRSTVLSPASLATLVDQISTVETSAARLVNLADDYNQIDWREQALLRLLDAFDADLSSAVAAFQSELLSDAPLDAALTDVTAAIAAVEVLLIQAHPFGQLLAPDVRLTPREPTFETQVRLRPRPSAFLGGRTFRGTVEESSGQTWLRTCTGGDASDTWFEHAFTLTKSAQSRLVVCPTEPVHDVLADVDSAQLLDTYAVDGRRVWTAEMSVIDYTGPTNYSVNAAASGGFLLRDGVMPVAGSYVRLGDEGEPRLYVGALGAPLELLGAGNGRWALVLVGDPAGDTPSGVAAYLGALAAAGGNVAVTQLGNTAAVDLRTAVSALTDDAFEELQLRVELDSPHDVSYPGIVTSGNYDALFVDDSTYPTTVGLSWQHSIYKPGSADWTARAVLYNNAVDQGETRTLRALCSGGLDELRRSLPGMTFVLSDPTGVEDNVEVVVLRVSVCTIDALDADEDFPQEGDILLHLDRMVPALPWLLCRDLPGVYLASPAPWRGITQPPDVAAGDLIFTDTGSPLVVLSAAGNLVRLQANLPESAGDVVRRFRHVRTGDDVVAWTGEVARTGRVQEIGWDGIRVSGLSAGSYDAAGFHREGSSVRCAEVVDSEGATLDLESYNFTEAWRRYAAPYAAGDALEDARVEWTVRVNGRAQAGVARNRILLELRSLLFPLGEGLIPATLAARVSARGLDATLDVREVWDDGDGEGLGAVPAGGAFILDLTSRSKARLRATTLPATPGSLGVSTLHALSRSYTGPLYQGGSPSFGAWSLCQYRFERRALLNLRELRADLGRARSLLGADRRAVTSGVLLLDPRGQTGTLTLSPSWGEAAVRGLELVDGGSSPLRIRRATLVSPGVFTVEFTRATTLTGSITVWDSAVGQAFREVYAVEQRLQDYLTWCGYLTTTTSVLSSAAQRLRAEGLDRAASVLLRGEFSRFFEGRSLSNWSGGLMDRAADLMQTLLDARSAPADL